MKPFHEVLDRPRNGWAKEADGRYTITIIEDDHGYTIELEPLLFGQWYLALYRDGGLVADKVPIRPGGYPEH